MKSTDPAITAILPVWSIPVFSLFLISLALTASMIGGKPAAMTTKDNTNPFAVSSGVFREEQRHLKESDKSPVLQWLEKARKEGKIQGHCVRLLKEKGSNADVILPELSGFLTSSGYQVSTDTASARLPVELLGLRFVAENDCVTIHIGLL